MSVILVLGDRQISLMFAAISRLSERTSALEIRVADIEAEMEARQRTLKAVPRLPWGGR